ncbi:MAG TPA: chorismate-binding protein, partial [Ignavibacteriaceae bacterium]|nr:chorismate-binding protein [Ignavibacteriaceae bacterium]
MENIVELTNTFNQFLSEKTAQQKENLQGSLISFASEIKSFDVENKIDSLLKSSENSFYFSSPGNHLSFFALDQAFNITENGVARFISTDKKLKELNGKFISNWNDLQLPLFIGGMKFTVEHSDDAWKDFSDSTWFVPELMICRMNEKTFLIYNYFVEQGLSKTRLADKFSKKLNSLSQISEDENNLLLRITNSSGLSPKDKKKWKQLITQALEKIHDKEIKKIVLSRKVELVLSDELNLTKYLNALRKDYPNCCLFAYHKGNSTFFGATPEILARIINNKIEVD